MAKIMFTPVEGFPDQNAFFGRSRELEEFRKSVQCILGTGEEPNEEAYPGIFLIYGQGGMGKSALLRQFRKISLDEGLEKERIIYIDLDRTNILSVDGFSHIIYSSVRQLHPDFGIKYHEAIEKKKGLLPKYRELQKQWMSWEALRDSSDDNLNQLEKNYKRQIQIAELKQSEFTTAYQPTFLIMEQEKALEELEGLALFSKKYGRTPQTFRELVEQHLSKEEASLFFDELQISQLLSDISELAEISPIIIIIDNYEKADQYDNLLRSALFSSYSDKMLTIISGRNSPIGGFKEIFRGAYHTYVRGYNLNIPLSLNEIRSYLKNRLEVEDDSIITDFINKFPILNRGIPLVIEAFSNQMTQIGNISAYANINTEILDQYSIIKEATDCFLRDVLDNRDENRNIRTKKLYHRYYIKSIAILTHIDIELLGILWKKNIEEVNSILLELTNEYPFVFDNNNIQSIIRYFIRLNIIINRQNDPEWQIFKPRLKEIKDVMMARIKRLERSIIDNNGLYTDIEWQNNILDLFNIILWSNDHNEACQLLLNNYIEAIYINTAFSDELLSLANDFRKYIFYMPQVIDALQTKNILNSPYYIIKWLHPRSYCILNYLSSKDIKINIESENYMANLKLKIEILERGYTAYNNWKPLQDELVQSLATLGHYYLYKQSNYKSALDIYDKILRIYPYDVIILKSRGLAKHNLRDSTGALADFELALTIKPGDISTILNRGQTKRLRGDLTGALLDFDKAHASRPQDPNILFVRGRLKFETNDLSGALQDFNQAFIIQPDYPELLYYRSLIHIQSGHYKQAIDDLDRALKLRPDDPDLLFVQGIAKAEKGDIDAALNHLDRVLFLRPNYFQAIYKRGLLRHIKGDLKAAIEDFEYLCKQAPENPRPFYQAARIYNKQQKHKWAIAFLIKAIKLDNNYRVKVNCNSEFKLLINDTRYLKLLDGASKL